MFHVKQKGEQLFALLFIFFNPMALRPAQYPGHILPGG
jgi:hypothetical protein